MSTLFVTLNVAFAVVNLLFFIRDTGSLINGVGTVFNSCVATVLAMNP